jgi:hypothetical protein
LCVVSRGISKAGGPIVFLIDRGLAAFSIEGKLLLLQL